MIAGGVFILLMALSVQEACSQQGGTPLVTVASITVQDVNPPDEYVGHVESIQSVDLIARVQGFLDEVCFQEGTDVAEGDLLYLIEQASYQATVNADKAAVAQAEAALLQTTQYLKRLREVSSGGVSATDLDNAEADELRAEAQLQRAKADLERAELDLNYTRVAAPISGRIGRTNFTRGNLVGPSTGPLARIVQLDPIRVVYSISENDLTALKSSFSDALQGESGAVLQQRIRLAGGDVYPYAGRIEFLDNVVDESTGTIAVRAVFPNPDGQLLPGQYVTTLVSKKDPRPMPVVPQAAVLEDRQGRYVLLVDAESQVVQRRIETGIMIEGYWSVEEGLSAGEQVVVEGIQKVQPGQSVATQAYEGQ
jgi:membrane fusion protein (multidrug efflux system)